LSEVGLPFVGTKEVTFKAFPAAKTETTPAFAATLSAEASAELKDVGEIVPAPQLLFFTLIAEPPYSNVSFLASLSTVPRKRIGAMVEDGATPDTPIPLKPTAAETPATAVP
jgi:hypothetical protein